MNPKSKYIPTFVLALFFALAPFVAQAHIPSVGDVAVTNALCSEAAKDEVLTAATTGGLSAIRAIGSELLRTGECYRPALGWVQVRAVAVIGPISMPDGRVIYAIQVVTTKVKPSPGAWFTFHTN